MKEEERRIAQRSEIRSIAIPKGNETPFQHIVVNTGNSEIDAEPNRIGGAESRIVSQVNKRSMLTAT